VAAALAAAGGTPAGAADQKPPKARPHAKRGILPFSLGERPLVGAARRIHATLHRQKATSPLSPAAE